MERIEGGEEKEERETDDRDDVVELVIEQDLAEDSAVSMGQNVGEFVEFLVDEKREVRGVGVGGDGRGKVVFGGGEIVRRSTVGCGLRVRRRSRRMVLLEPGHSGVVCCCRG